MNYRNVLYLTMGLFAVLLLIVGCGTPQPTPTEMLAVTLMPSSSPSPPTLTPTPEPPEWNYVAISFLIGSLDSPEAQYAANIERDLGVKVKLTPYTHFTTTHPCDLTVDMLTRLRTDRELQNAISQAQVVTMVPSPCDIFYTVTGDYRLERCGGADNMECVREAVVEYKDTCDAIFNEVLTLAWQGTIVRTMTLPHGDLMSILGYDIDLGPFYTLYNEKIVESALENNIPIARVDTAFHGPAGDEDARAKGYVTDSWFEPSPEGNVVIADLLRDLGYEPTVH